MLRQHVRQPPRAYPCGHLRTLAPQDLTIIGRMVRATSIESPLIATSGGAVQFTTVYLPPAPLGRVACALRQQINADC